MWKRFWKDLSMAMLMTDPIAYGSYWAWTLEAQEQCEPDMAPRRALRREPHGLKLARHPGKASA